MASIYQSIEILSKEKGIDLQILLDAVKDAMLVAARKQFKSEEELDADFDPKTGSLMLFAVKIVADPVADPVREISLEEALRYDRDAQIGTQIRFAKSTDALGRISAQTAKQVILQKVREAERENIYYEYSGRVGDLVNCNIKRIEGPDLIVDLGKTEARLPKKEQSRLENFTVGERTRVVIKSVDKTGKNAGVLVSRGAPELVMRLFEQEVPEIYDGTVVIRGCAREAGERTKISVFSKDRDVDCVGACVGMKGMRVQSIIRELRGEKIDIIEYSDDPIAFVTRALSPARISRVTVLDSTEKHLEVIVEDSQLSLAIGKKGQNVRLAAKLMGWRVDIKTEEEKRQEVEANMAALAGGTPLSVLLDQGLPESVLEILIGAGVGTVERIAAMTPEELELIQGIDDPAVSLIGASVHAFFTQAPAEAAPAAEAAEAAEATEGVETVPASETAGMEAALAAVDTAAVSEAAGETAAPQTTESAPAPASAETLPISEAAEETAAETAESAPVSTPEEPSTSPGSGNIRSSGLPAETTIVRDSVGDAEQGER